jgi:uncharacterized membrane protein
MNTIFSNQECREEYTAVSSALLMRVLQQIQKRLINPAPLVPWFCTINFHDGMSICTAGV